MTSATTPAETEAKPAEVQDETPDETAQQAPAVEAESSASAFTHVVLRSFHGSGTSRAAGEVVDASAWRSAERLCEMRYLRPLLAGDPEPVSDGSRFFIDDDSLLAFIDATETEED